MKKNISWETMISIIFAVIIILIIMFSIIKIVEYDNWLNYEYDKINYISILEKNTSNLIQKIDTSNLVEWDLFFLYKTWNEIQVFSWSENEDYKYINYLWEYTNTWSYNWVIYTRQCLVEKDSSEWQMIKCNIKEMIKK